MSPFLQRAQEIFETAAHGGDENCHLAILISRSGGIHMLSGSGWELERLREHYGARAAYRITRSYGQIFLEARAAGQSCLLKAESPHTTLRPSLPELARYEVLAWDNAGRGISPPA